MRRFGHSCVVKIGKFDFNRMRGVLLFSFVVLVLGVDKIEECHTRMSADYTTMETVMYEENMNMKTCNPAFVKTAGDGKTLSCRRFTTVTQDITNPSVFVSLTPWRFFDLPFPAFAAEPVPGMMKDVSHLVSKKMREQYYMKKVFLYRAMLKAMANKPENELKLHALLFGTNRRLPVKTPESLLPQILKMPREYTAVTALDTSDFLRWIQAKVDVRNDVITEMLKGNLVDGKEAKFDALSCSVMSEALGEAVEAYSKGFQGRICNVNSQCMAKFLPDFEARIYCTSSVSQSWKRDHPFEAAGKAMPVNLTPKQETMRKVLEHFYGQTNANARLKLGIRRLTNLQWEVTAYVRPDDVKNFRLEIPVKVVFNEGWTVDYSHEENSCLGEVAEYMLPSTALQNVQFSWKAVLPKTEHDRIRQTVRQFDGMLRISNWPRFRLGGIPRGFGFYEDGEDQPIAIVSQSWRVIPVRVQGPKVVVKLISWGSFVKGDEGALNCDLELNKLDDYRITSEFQANADRPQTPIRCYSPHDYIMSRRQRPPPTWMERRTWREVGVVLAGSGVVLASISVYVVYRVAGAAIGMIF